MTLHVGAKLGPYKIAGAIGAGGMGEVYRARDTRLGREVALKVLPDAFARDAERMARFEREAKVLASLNQTNIAAIYGFEESNGVRALVMELVEGPTLADRIAGAIPLDEALPIAKQICEALEYAHERGIVHRDLKPANVKITPDGAVKLLDFGLAKALEGDVAPGDISTSPTISRMATQAGIILGTAAYMSPEQAKGRPADRRADIWAFGCVLYEMVTGKKPFDGETISDVLAAVIRAEPDWAALPLETPRRIRELLERCLTKDLRQRLQSIAEARIAIDKAISGDVGADLVPARAEPAQARRQGSPLRRALPWIVAAGMGMIAAAAFGVIYLRAPAVKPAAIRSLIPAPQNASFGFFVSAIGVTGAPVLSPDGTRLAFPATDASGKEALWLRPLDSLAAQPLQGTEGATFPFWAPDSRQLGFFQDGELKKIDVTGGPPVTICDASVGRGGAWSSNDVIVFSSGGARLMSVPASGGTPTPLAAPKASGFTFINRWPVFLPDGRHFLYLSGDVQSPGSSKLGIRLGEIGSNEQEFLLQADSDALYASPGYLLFLRGDTLMAQRFDAASQKLKGDALPVAEPVGSPQSFRLGLFSVSQTGLLVYETGTVQGGGQLVWLDANGKEIAKVGQPGPVLLRLSPDGQQAAYALPRPGGGAADIWLVDLARGVETRFTFGNGSKTNFGWPVWSPDGSRITYFSEDQGQSSLSVRNASSAGSAEILLKSNVAGGQYNPTDWSRDGRYILFSRGSNLTGSAKASIWVLPLFGDRKPFPYLQTQFNVQDGSFSPDGRWVAYASDESGTYEVYLSPFPAGGGKWQVSQGGGIEPEWNRDGSALYYVTPDGKMMEVSVKESGSAVELGDPRQLFQVALTPFAPNYSVAPDGKRFLVDEQPAATSPPLTLVTNWTASLQK
jgi:Tol biopolymer transport system component